MINKMKRVNSFLIAAFVAASAMFVTSCGNDDEVEDPEVTVKVTTSDKPTMTENVGANATVTRDEGIIVTFDIDFKQGTNKMSSISITSTVDGIGTFAVWDTTKMEGGMLNLKGGKTFSKSITTKVGKVTETFEFKMVDTKSNPSSFTLIVKPTPSTDPEPPAGSYSSSTVKLYGQTSSAGGSSYSYQMGRDLKLTEAKSQSAVVDFMYYYGSTNEATISSPKDDQITQIFSSVSSWSVKNDTRFAKVDGVSVPSDNSHDSWWSSVPAAADITATKATKLAPNDVYAFKTADGKVRVFVVTNIGVKSGAGDITLRIIEKN